MSLQKMWIHMNYIYDTFIYFLKSEWTLKWRDRNLSGFIKNIFICVSKMHESLGLKWHESK